MLCINLLPEQEKKTIAFEQWQRIIRFFGISVSMVLLIGIALLAPSYLPLYFQRNALQYSLAIQQDAAKRIHANTIAQDSLRIKSIISSLRPYSDIQNNALTLFDLLLTHQSGIIITSFSIDKSAHVSLAGNASTRNNLLLFEQRLRDSAQFQDIASPLANIIQEANINFTFNATLKPSYAL